MIGTSPDVAQGRLDAIGPALGRAPRFPLIQGMGCFWPARRRAVVSIHLELPSLALEQLQRDYRGIRFETLVAQPQHGRADVAHARGAAGAGR